MFLVEFDCEFWDVVIGCARLFFWRLTEPNANLGRIHGVRANASAASDAVNTTGSNPPQNASSARSTAASIPPSTSRFAS